LSETGEERDIGEGGDRDEEVGRDGNHGKEDEYRTVVRMGWEERGGNVVHEKMVAKRIDWRSIK
jgi:hypothetical protein